MIAGSLFRLAPGRSLTAALGLALFSAACHGGGGDQAPSCGAVAVRFVQLAQADLAQAKIDEATDRAVADQLPAMRDALAQACSDGKWTPATRACLVQANDHVSFEACEQQLTDEQRRDLSRSDRETSASGR